MDNPPVNALSPGVPEGIIASVERGNADPAVKAMVLIGAGRSFIAGADIRQFGQRRPVQLGKRQHDVLDGSQKPIVAAIHGYALGGGLEIALASNYRIAVPSAKVGLPEVLIGILPGSGGTQRMPRLVGPKMAMELITLAPPCAGAGGERARHHRRTGAGGQRPARCRHCLREARRRHKAIAAHTGPRRQARRGEGRPGRVRNFRKSIARRARNQKAPYNCIAAIEAACTLPFDEGIKRERELFDELENSDEARALRYAFFAEREAQKIPGIDRSTATPDRARASSAPARWAAASR